MENFKIETTLPLVHVKDGEFHGNGHSGDPSSGAVPTRDPPCRSREKASSAEDLGGQSIPLLSDESGADESDGDDREDRLPLPELRESREKLWQIALQVFFPYLIAGYGMVAAGSVLEVVKRWPVFTNVSEVIILVPPLLGLKGNLEMTLASRLSTQANLGHLDAASEQWLMIGGNLALVQAQAIIVGLLSAIFAIILGWVPEGKFSIVHGCFLCASSIITAAVTSFVLGSVMVGVVMLSRKFHINPDNVATPVAASLGDLSTVSLLAGVSMVLFGTLEQHFWVSPLLIVVVVAFIPLWWWLAHRNKYTTQVLYSGWTPVIGAMVISSIGGLVLDYTVSYDGIAVFQPVINGVGGNLVAVQASRLSTALHQVSVPGTLPKNAVQGCVNPLTMFCGKGISSRTAFVLLLMVIPGQIIFLLTIHLMNETKDFKITVIFAVIYVTAAVVQVAILLFIANWLVHFLWRRGNDPDNFSIPYLTAIGDLLGTVLLALAFLIYDRIADHT